MTNEKDQNTPKPDFDKILESILLLKLDLDQKNGNWDTGRFRSAYLSDDHKEIWIHTRNGGYNRDCFPDGIESHPNYLRDFDEDDPTYATIVFSVPDGLVYEIKHLLKAVKNEL